MGEDRLQITLAPSEKLSLNLMDKPETFSVNLVPPVPQSTGTSDYNALNNKPRINDVILKNNKSLEELGIQPAGDYAESALTNMEIEALLRNFV